MQNIGPFCNNVTSHLDVDANFKRDRNIHIAELSARDQRTCITTKQHRTRRQMRQRFKGSHVKIAHHCVCCGVPRVCHVHLCTRECLAISTGLVACHPVPNEDAHHLLLHHHSQCHCLSWSQRQHVFVAAPVSAVAVAILAVPVHHKKLSRIRPEPDCRNTGAVVTTISGTAIIYPAPRVTFACCNVQDACPII